MPLFSREIGASPSTANANARAAGAVVAGALDGLREAFGQVTGAGHDD